MSRPRGTQRRVWLVVLAGWLALTPAVVPGESRAFVPTAARTMKAIAEVNRASGRTRAIQLELTMRIGDRPPVAEGELISHPSGLARLELRGYQGRVDRYVLSGNELLATKDGEPLEQPRPMLQPFFLLQPDSEETLRAALAAFGVRPDVIGLAPCGERDCFVIGDPRLAAPLEPRTGGGPKTVLDAPPAVGAGPDAAAGRGDMATETATDASAEPLTGPSLSLPDDGARGGGSARLPRIWVDTRDLQVQRIDRASGVFMILGPIVAFERLEVPAWLEIHEPGEETIRFDVDRAVQVNAPAKAFGRKWLAGPEPDPSLDASAP